MQVLRGGYVSETAFSAKKPLCLTYTDNLRFLRENFFFWAITFRPADVTSSNVAQNAPMLTRRNEIQEFFYFFVYFISFEEVKFSTHTFSIVFIFDSPKKKYRISMEPKKKLIVVAEDRLCPGTAHHTAFAVSVRI